MKIVVTILSDIHFTSSAGHPIIRRVESIAAAISSAEVQPDGFLFILCGDIADRGEPSEYAIAEDFLKELKAVLLDRFPRTPQYCASVAGNHDLLHPDGSEHFRKTLIEGALSTLKEFEPDKVYLNQLLEPQKAYLDFAKTLNLTGDGEYPKICSSSLLTLGNETVRLNFLNTALLSQLREKQSSLLLPVQLIRRILPADEQSTLTITVMHHPIYWIESNTLTDLRDFLGRTTDYVITGHQHFSTGYEQKDDLGPNVKYYESPALFDPKAPVSSAFRVLVFDLEKGSEKQLIFRWKSERYLPDSKWERLSDWTQLVKNRTLRPSLDINSRALEEFNDPGFAYVNRSDLRLSDVYVYPELRIGGNHGAESVRFIKSQEAVGFLTEPGVKILQGAPLCGKTSFSKKLMLDLRAQNSTIPVWLDGKTLICTSVDDFRKSVLAAFAMQYSKEQRDIYTQLSIKQRAIIIDNWHQAVISAEVRNAIYKWLNDFAASSVLLADQVYQLAEILALAPREEEVAARFKQSVQKVQIEQLSNVSRAELIAKWLKYTRNSEPLAIEEGKELLRVEDLVSSVLGKDRLPLYPFFILCILQALDNKKTEAIAGGSFGPLYEIFIFTALEKTEAGDPQISKKLVFLQEVAFFMWKRRITAISRNDIEILTKAYVDKHFLNIPIDLFVKELKLAKILTSSDHNYSFSYQHYFYYFVARYIRDHIEDEERNNLQLEVDRMIDHISSIENSTIVMFLIYFEKEKHRIIDRLVSNASTIYKSVPPSRLEDDVKVFSSLQTNLTPPAVEEESDVAKNRHELRVRKDESEQLSLGRHRPDFEVIKDYEYSEDLPDPQKFHLAQQTINALGQVIRNFSANLDGPRKVTVLTEAYLLGLRTLGRMIQIFTEMMAGFDVFEGQEDSGKTFRELRQQIDQMFIGLAQILAVMIFESTSGEVGVRDMEMAYNAVLRKLEKTIAIRMMSLTVQLHHYESFPENEIRELHRDIKSNSFALGVLQWLVASYLMMNRVERSTQRNMARLFNLDIKLLKT